MNQSQRRPVARNHTVINIVAIGQMGFSGAHVARALNVTVSAVSKLFPMQEMTRLCQRLVMASWKRYKNFGMRVRRKLFQVSTVVPKTYVFFLTIGIGVFYP